MARKQKTEKKKQSVAAQQTTSVSLETMYRLVGAFSSFIAILGIGQFGAIGILVANGFRLLIGETYSLLMVALLFLGLSLVWRGELRTLPFRRLLGAFILLVSLTTWLHFRTFSPMEPLPVSIFEQTYEMFRMDILVGQVRLPIGGGLLGAVFYSLFGYLFGAVGTYLFVVIVFVIGLTLWLEVSFQAWLNGVTHIYGMLQDVTERLFPRYESQEDERYLLDEIAIEDNGKLKEPKVSWICKVQQEIFGLDEADETFFEESFIDEQPEDDLITEVPIEVLENVADESADTNVECEPVPIVTMQQLIVTPPQSQSPLQEEATMHWQEQANERQALTEEPLEELLHQAEEMPIPTVKVKKTAHYQLPSKTLLKQIPPVDQSEEYARINENIKKLEQTFASFGVDAKVVKANLGPAVTKYEIQPAIGVKVSKIVSLSDDIALALAARDIRMEAPIPGKSLIGIEVPNHQVSPVSYWEIIDAALESPHLLEVPLGRDISGAVCLADLSKMPHLLIAGATGAGKSVGMNVIIVSLLMKAKPDEVKFLMIDPKKVELTMYDGIPHLLAPVVTNPRKAAQALNKVVQEMERRYELFATTGVRNIDGYNDNIDQYNREHQTGYEPLPKIVVFVDELADLMMVASNEVENAIIRLAQMARAAGIHMIIATQRPSVDVITGIIKANVPSRLAFAVSSGTDSRTILDSNGAEKLLGRGDMLFQPMGKNKPVRVQGAYISDAEVDNITQFVKQQQEADYDDSMIVSDDETGGGASASDDEYFSEAVALIKGLETISISQLQRRFRIGYNRAARLIDDLEAQGMIGPQDGSKPRQVFIQE